MDDDLKDGMSLGDLTEAGEPAAEKAPGYDDWKRRKVGTALHQSEDRSAVIPSHKVWERFGFER